MISTNWNPFSAQKRKENYFAIKKIIGHLVHSKNETNEMSQNEILR